MKLRLVVLSVVALSVLACAGGSPCAQLKCGSCSKPGQKMACDAIVNSDNQKACEIALTKPDFKTCQ
jgi:hypothetical protein